MYHELISSLVITKKCVSKDRKIKPLLTRNKTNKINDIDDKEKKKNKNYLINLYKKPLDTKSEFKQKLGSKPKDKSCLHLEERRLKTPIVSKIIKNDNKSKNHNTLINKEKSNSHNTKVIQNNIETSNIKKHVVTKYKKNSKHVSSIRKNVADNNSINARAPNYVKKNTLNNKRNSLTIGKY